MNLFKTALVIGTVYVLVDNLLDKYVGPRQTSAKTAGEKLGEGVKQFAKGVKEGYEKA